MFENGGNRFSRVARTTYRGMKYFLNKIKKDKPSIERELYKCKDDECRVRYLNLLIKMYEKRLYSLYTEGADPNDKIILKIKKDLYAYKKQLREIVSGKGLYENIVNEFLSLLDKKEVVVSAICSNPKQFPYEKRQSLCESIYSDAFSWVKDKKYKKMIEESQEQFMGTLSKIGILREIGPGIADQSDDLQFEEEPSGYDEDSSVDISEQEQTLEKNLKDARTEKAGLVRSLRVGSITQDQRPMVEDRIRVITIKIERLKQNLRALQNEKK